MQDDDSVVRNAKLPRFVVAAGSASHEITGKRTEDGHMEYIINGDQQIPISWYM